MPFQDPRKLDTLIRFYEGTFRNSGNISFRGCICSIKGVMGTADKNFEAAVIHPEDPVVLVATCTGVSGRLVAKQIVRIMGCPVKVADLMIFGLRHLGMQSGVEVRLHDVIFIQTDRRVIKGAVEF